MVDNKQVNCSLIHVLMFKDQHFVTIHTSLWEDIVNFEHISHLVVVFLLLIVNFEQVNGE